MIRLITASELSRLTGNELRALYREVYDEMVNIPQTDPDYMTAVASLQNIRNALNSRKLSGPKM